MGYFDALTNGSFKTGKDGRRGSVQKVLQKEMS